MKTEKQIEIEIENLKTLLLENKTEYSRLNQIDLLSGEGADLRRRIANLEGNIKALEWVIS